jgi:hypothetical protein
MENETHKEFFGKSRWPGYPKNHTCACGAVFLANAPKAKWCKECSKRKNREIAIGTYYKKRRQKIAKLARGLQKLLEKTRDEMSMKDHWLKEAYLKNVKTLVPLKAFAKAVEQVKAMRTRQNVLFTKQERENIKKIPQDKQTRHEEQILREFGY